MKAVLSKEVGGPETLVVVDEAGMAGTRELAKTVRLSGLEGADPLEQPAEAAE